MKNLSFIILILTFSGCSIPNNMPDQDNDGLDDDFEPCPEEPWFDLDCDIVCAGKVNNSNKVNHADCIAENVHNNKKCSGVKNEATHYRGNDNCPITYNPDQKDTDKDGIGDACDSCPWIANPEPEDQEFWENCDDYSDTDTDGDCIGDSCDNCPEIFNPDQENNNNGVGDVCAE